MYRHAIVSLALCCMLEPAEAAAYPRPPGSGPLPIGAPHTCIDNYPATALHAHVEGTTLVSYQVTSTGAVANAAVARSSGNSDLDSASINCVSKWQFQPATDHGVPIEVSWQSRIEWMIATTKAQVINPAPIGAHHMCSLSEAIPALVIGKTGDILLVFTVGIDGNVHDLKIAKTSGSLTLDGAALDCIRAWKYNPATRDGAPTEVDWMALVNYSRHR